MACFDFLRNVFPVEEHEEEEEGEVGSYGRLPSPLNKRLNKLVKVIVKEIEEEDHQFLNQEINTIKKLEEFYNSYKDVALEKNK